jgi:DNA-binding transcriptional regulator/RsmH inhibitor MraZ
MTDHEVANRGEIRPPVASWGEIDADSRLHVPSDVLSYLTWYETRKPCAVLVELREPGCLRLHHGDRIRELTQQRQTVLEEFDDQIEAQRRVAISHAIFIPATIGEKNRRITLRASVLDHLRISKLARVLCLGYANHLEILSEERAATLVVATRIDIDLGSETNE